MVATLSCHIVNLELSDVCVYARVHCGSRTRNFNVPFITNDGDLAEGEELIVEVAPKAKLVKKRNRTWRQVEQDEKTEMFSKVS